NPVGLFTLMAPPPGSVPDWFLHGDADYEEAAAGQGRDLREPVPAQDHGQAARGAGVQRLRWGADHPLRGGVAGRPWLSRPGPGPLPGAGRARGAGVGRCVLRAASGLAALEPGRPMAPGLRFRAGSVTKSLVATVVLRLVAEG